MSQKFLFEEFIKRLRLLIDDNPDLISMTLSNIFTMRLLGNKTHGDLAEVAVVEFVNQYMYDYRSEHVGKELFRAKTKEEDIRIINRISEKNFPVSLKAYGAGPLQLSTDKNGEMFPFLERKISNKTESSQKIQAILSNPAFGELGEMNVLPLIYDESEKKCNILVFDYEKACGCVAEIRKCLSGSGRKHPVFLFLDKEGEYIFEARYGGKTANALQRGLWTNTKRAAHYFHSVTGGWIDYSHNLVLVKLFSHALVASESGHESALDELKRDIKRLQRKESR